LDATVYISRRTLGAPGEVENTVLKGERILVTDIFVDTDGVTCADAKAPNGRRISIPMSYLTKTDDSPPQPSEALTAGVGRG
jgi:hypothetical protein